LPELDLPVQNGEDFLAYMIFDIRKNIFGHFKIYVYHPDACRHAATEIWEIG